MNETVAPSNEHCDEAHFVVTEHRMILGNKLPLAVEPL